MMKKKITLEDIARATELSTFSVSRALNGKPGVSEKTRTRVLKVAKDLGYSRQINRNSKVIVLVIPEYDLNDATFWMRVLEGIENNARKMSYSVQIKLTNEMENSFTASDIEKADGVIYAGHKSLAQAIKFGHITPSLLMTYPPNGLLDLDVIHTGDVEAGFAMCQNIIQYGHTRIGFYGTIERPSTINRLAGVKEALKLYNLSLAYTWEDKKYSQTELMKEELTKLNNTSNLPTAIICSHERLAQTVVFILNKLHLSVPESISVVALNCDLSTTQILPFSGAAFNLFEYGRLASQMLFDRIENPGMPYTKKIVLPKLIFHDTAGPMMRNSG